MDINKKVLQYFDGIDELRAKKKSEIANIKAQSDRYNAGYIRDYVEQVRNELIADRKERAEKAKEAINNAIEELRTKRFKDPYDDINESIIKPEHKLLVEMQQARNLDLLKVELEAAENPNDFKALIEQYGENEHFFKLINLEIKKRAKGDSDGDASKFIGLQAELNQDPEEIQGLKKLYHTVNFLGGSDMHPIGIENGDLSNIQFESLV